MPAVSNKVFSIIDPSANLSPPYECNKKSNYQKGNCFFIYILNCFYIKNHLGLRFLVLVFV
ncbi:hypothetical protein QEW_4526 [Clostridioides difficile CD160]|nr:hypothetical protein QEW_4526 [Clostridioides difficile CD160]